MELVSATAAYVAALDRTLVGPSRVRRDLVREAHDHLSDAVDAYCRAGYDRPEAERRAVDDFGPLGDVAPAFQTTLAVASARRTAWLLLGVLAVQPFLWDGPVDIGTEDATSSPGSAYAALDWIVEVLGAVSMAAAVVLVAATTIGNRWFRAGRGVARVTSVVAIGATLSLVAIGALMSALSGGLAAPYWVMVATCLFAPMSAAAWSGRRTLATC